MTMWLIHETQLPFLADFSDTCNLSALKYTPCIWDWSWLRNASYMCYETSYIACVLETMPGPIPGCDCENPIMRPPADCLQHCLQYCEITIVRPGNSLKVNLQESSMALTEMSRPLGPLWLGPWGPFSWGHDMLEPNNWHPEEKISHDK